MRYNEVISERVNPVIKESFWNAYQAPNGYVEIFVNPSKAEFLKIFNEHRGARGFLDESDGEPRLYVWDSYLATHEDIDSQFNLWGERCEWFEPEKLVIYWNWVNHDNSERFQNFTEVREYLLGLAVFQRIGVKEIVRA